MEHCRICNKLSYATICSTVCENVVKETKERIDTQMKEYNTVLRGDQKPCKICGKPRKKYAQFCVSCAKSRTKEKKREFENKKKKQRICKNKECSNILKEGSPSSQKYCSDKCRPSRTRAEEITRRIERGEEIETYDKYKGTVDPKWLRRGAISSNTGVSSGTGLFVYEG